MYCFTLYFNTGLPPIYPQSLAHQCINSDFLLISHSQRNKAEDSEVHPKVNLTQNRL